MLPEVEPDERLPSGHQGVLLVGRGLEHQLLVLGDGDPDPSAAEDAEGLLGEHLVAFLLVGEELAERFAQRTFRTVAAFLPEALPEERMVVVAAAVVPHRGADLLGDLVEALAQLLGAELLEVGIVGERLVEVVHVGRVVLAVVDLHRLRIEVRLERREGVGQRRQLVRTGDGRGLGERARQGRAEEEAGAEQAGGLEGLAT